MTACGSLICQTLDITPTQEKNLQLGLNFAISPKSVRTEKLCAEIEKGISKFLCCDVKLSIPLKILQK